MDQDHEAARERAWRKANDDVLAELRARVESAMVLANMPQDPPPLNRAQRRRAARSR